MIRRPAPSPERRHPGAALLGVVAPLLLAACGGGSAPAPAPATGRAGRPVPVGVEPVARGPLVRRVEGTGSLEAYQVVVVAARLDGVVEQVGVEEGDAVEPTRVLAVIDAERRRLERDQAQALLDEALALGPRAQASAARARAGVARAQAQLRAAESDLAEAEQMLARRELMRAERPGVVPEEEVATTAALVARRRDAVGVARSAVAEAEAEVSQAAAEAGAAARSEASARARLALAEKAAADTAVRAPLVGVVRRRSVTVGQYVRAGDPLLEIVDRSRLRARFRVAEAESVRLQKDQTVGLQVPSLSGEGRPARLIHVDETANAVSRMVECLAELDAPPEGWKPGFFVLARVDLPSAPVLHVPEAALQPSEQGWTAYVAADGRAERRRLRIGLRTAEGRVEVLDGLAEAESLIVAGANVVSEGQAVSVTRPPAPAAPAGAPAGAAPGRR